MNINETLSSSSKKIIELVADAIIHHPQEINKLFDILYINDPQKSMRAAWAISFISEKSPLIIKPYINTIISEIESCKNDSIRRGLLRSLTFQELDENMESIGILADNCFSYLSDNNASIAIKVYSIDILYKICLLFPELKNELSSILNELLIEDTPAIKSKSKKTLHKLSVN